MEKSLAEAGPLTDAVVLLVAELLLDGVGVPVAAGDGLLLAVADVADLTVGVVVPGQRRRR